MGKDDIKSLKDNEDISKEVSEKKINAIKKREMLLEPFEEYKS